MNIPFDILIKMLEYEGNYNNFLLLNKKLNLVFNNTELYAHYKKDIKSHILKINNLLQIYNNKINFFNKRLRLYRDPEIYNSYDNMNNLINIHANSRKIILKLINELNKEKIILNKKIE